MSKELIDYFESARGHPFYRHATLAAVVLLVLAQPRSESVSLFTTLIEQRNECSAGDI